MSEHGAKLGAAAELASRFSGAVAFPGHFGLLLHSVVVGLSSDLVQVECGRAVGPSQGWLGQRLLYSDKDLSQK
jgi:hypothetical protein